MKKILLAIAVAAPSVALCAGGSESWGEGVTLWREDGFAQELHAQDFRHVQIVDRARDPETGEWVEVERVNATTPYRVWKFASAHLDVLGLAGFAPNGDIVIERWQLVNTGAPLDSETANLPARLRVPKELVRTTIYRGPLGKGVYELGFDLRARYLLALVTHADGVTLYRFDNQSPAVPQVVLDSEVLPVLGRMRTLQQRRHRGLGYVWQMQDHPLGGSEYILLVDGDDDAAFDGQPLVGNRKWYEAAGFANHESWGDRTDPLRR